MKLIEAISKRLNVIIAESGLTEYKIAKDAGIPRSTIWKIANPDLTSVKTVKIDTLFQILSTLEISLKDFFDDPIFDEVND